MKANTSDAALSTLNHELSTSPPAWANEFLLKARREMVNRK